MDVELIAVDVLFVSGSVLVFARILFGRAPSHPIHRELESSPDGAGAHLGGSKAMAKAKKNRVNEAPECWTECGASDGPARVYVKRSGGELGTELLIVKFKSRAAANEYAQSVTELDDTLGAETDEPRMFMDGEDVTDFALNRIALGAHSISDGARSAEHRAAVGETLVEIEDGEAELETTRLAVNERRLRAPAFEGLDSDGSIDLEL